MPAETVTPAPPPRVAASAEPERLSTNETPKPELRLTDMVSGIVTDFQKLISQQISLLRAELRTDWEKSKRAMAPIVIGILCGAAAAMLFAFCAAYALHWSMMPDTSSDPSRLPLWACFGIVGLVFAAVGGGLVMMGTWAFQAFNPLPDETVSALEKNIKAITESRVGASQS